jgi:hypothetical protein
MPRGPRADTHEHVPCVGLPLILVALVVGGFLVVRQLQTNGPAPAVTQIVTQAESNVAGANFASAAPALQAWYTENGTYAGATPCRGPVSPVRADATGYCLQADVGGAQEHEVGPQGRPQAGLAIEPI